MAKNSFLEDVILLKISSIEDTKQNVLLSSYSDS